MSEQLTNRKVILFNGPPGVGKDTAAMAVCGYISTHAPWMQPRHMKFAEPLKKAVHALFDTFQGPDYYDKYERRGQKDLANDDFLGMSPREAYIAMSEKFLKPEFGNSALGYIMRRRMLKAQGAMVFVMSDSGFIYEIEPVLRLVSEENVLICELHAIDKTFEGDSRGYIGAQAKELFPKITVRKIQNTISKDNSEIEIFKLMCCGAAKSFLQLDEK